MVDQIQRQDFEKMKNLLLEALSDRGKLFGVALSVARRLKSVVITKLNSMDNLRIDHQLMRSFGRAPKRVRLTMSNFIPILNSCGAHSSGFIAASQAITGTQSIIGFCIKK